MTPQLTGRMPSVCMVCGDTYATKPCVPEHDGKPSHGYCPACFPGVMARLEREWTFLDKTHANAIPSARH
jgi:hypothetical protein